MDADTGLNVKTCCSLHHVCLSWMQWAGAGEHQRGYLCHIFMEVAFQHIVNIQCTNFLTSHSWDVVLLLPCEQSSMCNNNHGISMTAEQSALGDEAGLCDMMMYMSCDSVNRTLYGARGHLDDTVPSSAQHECRQEICMRATQTNMEDGGTWQRAGTNPNRRRTPANQPRQNEALAPKKKGLFLSHGRGLGIKRLAQTRNRPFHMVII